MKTVTATIAQLLLCPPHKGCAAGDVTSKPMKHLLLNQGGVVEDRHWGKTLLAGARQARYATLGTTLPNLRQLSIVSEEELAEIAQILGIREVTGADLGANIVTRGVRNLTAFPAGVNSVISFERDGVSPPALLYCTGENEPCGGPGVAIAKRVGQPELANHFQKAAMHRRGIVAMVARPGRIITGGTIELMYHDWTGWNPEQ